MKQIHNTAHSTYELTTTKQCLTTVRTSKEKKKKNNDSKSIVIRKQIKQRKREKRKQNHFFSKVGINESKQNRPEEPTFKSQKLRTLSLYTQKATHYSFFFKPLSLSACLSFFQSYNLEMHIRIRYRL